MASRVFRLLPGSLARLDPFCLFREGGKFDCVSDTAKKSSYGTTTAAPPCWAALTIAFPCPLWRASIHAISTGGTLSFEGDQFLRGAVVSRSRAGTRPRWAGHLHASMERMDPISAKMAMAMAKAKGPCP